MPQSPTLEERLRSALEAAETGTWRVDLKTGLDTRDAIVNEILGLPPTETTLPLDDFISRVHPEDRPLVTEHLSRVVSERVPYRLECRVVRPDGSIRWLRDRGHVVCNGSGEPVAITGAVVDVTELKLAQLRSARLQALTSTLADLRPESEITAAVVDHCLAASGAQSAAIALIEPGGTHLAVAAQKGFDERLIQQWSRFPVQAETPLAEAFRTGRAVFLENREEFARRYPVLADAVFRSTHEAAATVPLVIGGELQGALGLRYDERRHFDVGEIEFIEACATQCGQAIHRARLHAQVEADRHRLEEASAALRATEERLRRALADAEAASRAKDEFLAMLGHELRNPLAPILTALELMRLRGGDVLGREREIVERQVQHMVRLVDDLLDVSRITRGKVELRKAPVELSRVIAAAIETASPLIEQRRHMLAVDVPTHGLVIYGDEHRLVQVFANLLTNAAKFTPSSGHITIRAEGGEGQVTVWVRDDGIGISAKLLPRMFDLFIQSEQTIERAEGGLGLGLAIVRSLVASHGGTVSAQSEGRGRGSEFRVTLPLYGVPAIPADQRAAKEDGVAREYLRILVVDDNVDAAETIADALDMEGHQVRIAHDGPAALKIASAFQPQLALVDIGLPVMDGYEVAARLREQAGGLPIRLVAVTGYGQDSDRVRSAAAGFDRHLVKPVSLDDLIEIAAASLRSNVRSKES